MKNSVKKISLWDNKNLELSLHSRLLTHSAWIRESTESILNTRQSENHDRKVICIDGTDFSSNIISVYNSKISNYPLLLPAWIDWVIMQTHKNYELILPVADCAAIWAWNKDSSITWLFHAWYKWVAWNWENLWIINHMFNELSRLNSNDLSDFNFYLSPMMWKDFELPLNYVRNLFKKILTEFNLEEEKYFSSHNFDKEKIYLDLKEIILDIFKEFWVKKSKIKSYSWKPTNDPDSIYPSFRLHSIAKTIQKKSQNTEFSLDWNNKVFWIEKELLTPQEFELIISWKIDKYLTDYRLALILKNKVPS